MRRFYVVFDGNLSDEIFSDFKSDNRVICLQHLLYVKSPVVKFLRKVHLSLKINKYLPLPFKHIWSGVFHALHFDAEKLRDQWIIFFNGGVYPLSEQYMKKIKREYNVHFVLFMADPWLAAHAEMARRYVSVIDFDYIFSFDENDSKKYGFIYEFVPYSKREIISKPIYDLYFVGNNSGRLPLICDIEAYSKKEDRNITLLFQVSGTEKESRVLSENIEYLDKNIEYSKVLQYVLDSNCILEIIKNGQSGATLRYYESVCYNKKLLTTNKNIVNMPFYDPRYMKVFEKPEDIDWNWVKERIPVDYHYDGRFSPIHFIDKIIELEEKGSKELVKEQTD